MTKVSFRSFVVVALCFSTVSANAQPTAAPTSPNDRPAELILKNGKIFTDHDTDRNWSQAMSVRDGNILSIGTTASVEKDKGPGTQIIDLKGKVVLPGFNDSHAHFIEGGLALIRLDLSKVRSIPEMQKELKTYASANPKLKWILGSGWDHTAFGKNQTYPTRTDLDVAVPDRPVLLWHTDHHLLVLNSKALAALDITRDTTDLAKEILKDEKGEPSGVLLENTANNYASEVDKPTSEELHRAFNLALEEAAKYGVTSIQGGPIRGKEELNIVEEFYRAKKLSIRFSLWGELEKTEDYLSWREKFKNIPEEWLRLDTVKGFIDGIISARTAAMLDPYTDSPSTKGDPQYTQDKLNELVLSANRQGLTVALHAIGDRAVSMAMSSFVRSRGLLFNSRLRNRIEHLEVVPAHIYSKFSEKNIIASVQPSHMVYDKEELNYNEQRLGRARVQNAFAWHNFLKEKAHLAFGTDWPVMPLNPMIGLMAAVYRQHYNAKPPLGWISNQRIKIEPALNAYTLGGAYATREEHVKGTIREGKYADMVVLDHDVFKASAKELLNTKIVYTIVAGKIVFDGSQPQFNPAK